jgi:outer membrane protein TolC
MKARFGLRVLFFLLAPVSLSQAENKSLTLHECINEALGRSPRLTSEQYNLAGDQEAIKKARAGLLPNLQVHGALENLTGSPISPFSVLGINEIDVTGVVTNRSNAARANANFDTVGTGSLVLNYPLYQKGSILGLNNAPAVAAAKSTYVRQQWTIRLSEQTVIETLAGAYFNATAYQRKVEIDQHRVELSKKRLEITQQELALGLTLPQNVELAKAELAADQQLLQAGKQRAADGTMQLAQLIGRPLHQQLNLDLSEPRIPPLPPLDQLLNRVAKTHPAIGMQQANIDVAKQNLRIAESALWPTVNLTSSYTQATAFATENPHLFTFGLNVSIPVFDWGYNLDNKREERDRLKAAQAELGQVDLDLRESILTLLSDIHTTESSIAALESDYVQAKNIFDLTNEQHEQGIAKELALVNAESDLVRVKDQLILAKLVQQLQYVQLQKVSGGVWAWNK